MTTTTTAAVSAPALWPHQREAIDAVLHTGLAEGARSTVVLPCGTGKTRVGSEIGQQLAPGGRVLVVEPTIELVGQTLHAWRQAHGEHALGRTVALCSDPGVMDQRGLELRDSHAAVTTDPVQLAVLATGEGRVTVVSTYAGMNVVAAAHANHGLPQWDLIIVDEAHRTAGAAGKAWAVVHDDAVLPAARRLYLTATPRMVADTSEGRASIPGVSMDDEKIYGPTCYKMSFSRARDLGLLADYRVVVSVTSDAQVQALAAEQCKHFKVGRTALTADMLARQIAVLRAAEQHHIRRMITYHGRISDAKWFAKTLPSTAPLLAEDDSPTATVWAGHVHGGQPVAERRAVLSRLRGDAAGLVVVANARVLTEGVDAPAVDGIAFLDPRKSVIDIIQALGRAMRLGGQTDKTASIVVPVLLGPGEDPAEALEGSAFQQVWRIARALRAHDEALGEQLDSARLRLGTDAGHTAGSAAELPDWLTITGIDVPPGFAAAITARAVRTTTSSWQEHYGAAIAYQQTHGDLQIPQMHTTSSELALGTWLSKQRFLHSKGQLLPDRKRLLDDLGVAWAPKTEIWKRNLAAAQAYFTEHGHLRVPANHTVTVGTDDVELGTFVRAVRQGLIHLDAPRRAALDEIDMVWNVLEDLWQRHFAAAQAYRDKHGDLLVHKDFVTDDDPPLPLGQWIVTMRSKRERQSPDRIKELDTIGMVWNVSEHKWQRNFAAAQDYYARHGHLDMRYTHTTAGPDPVPLGSWIGKQRTLHNNGKLSPERFAALTAIGMTW
ncbi:Helicase associated domain protein [Streptomyces sp. NPDC020707]|uniref:DEAD/DEAH box helicase n=1 Tax=Streptomyces sp. NPDC020707 TaxID=3365084 RepID=UPI0037B5CE79